MQFVHVWALSGLAFFLAAFWLFQNALHKTLVILARKAEVARRNDACAEAFALIQYGATQEAIDILNEQDEVFALAAGDQIIARLLFQEDWDEIKDNLRAYINDAR